jgi:hypothetical protein
MRRVLISRHFLILRDIFAGHSIGLLDKEIHKTPKMTEKQCYV